MDDYAERLQTSDEVLRGVEEKVTELEKLQPELEDANGKLQEHITESAELLADLLRRSVQNVDPATKNLDEVIRQAEATTRRCLKALNALGNDDAPGGTWDKFLSSELPNVERLFSEYIDLLGGIAIRERGLTLSLGSSYRLDQLCSMTDHLVLQGDRPRKRISSLSVPGRALGEVDSWPLLRLGLAQFSIWGIPLQAYEFGRLATADTVRSLIQSPDCQTAIEQLRGAENVRALAADAFATFALGPAYACALLYLRLLPKPSRKDDIGVDSYRACIEPGRVSRRP